MLSKGKSTIDGLGIFSSSDISGGTAFYEIPTGFISADPKPKFARIGKNRYVSDSKVLNWVNHSCEANTILDISTEMPSLIARRNIEKGEEITCDYDLTEVNGSKVKCNCGSKNCRGYFLREE